MNGRQCDFVIVGGGLSGGLIAAALANERPELTVQLIETGDTLGGNHRWSWFGTDITDAGRNLLEPFRKVEWNSGYDVQFPGHQRSLSTPYRSMASAEFDAALRRALPQQSIRTNRTVETLDAKGVTLTDGERIGARIVIDCRGPAVSQHLKCKWQVFLGRHIRTTTPHGVKRPTVMDACVEQHGTFHFVRVLPLGAYDLFVEDTYYTDSPTLDRSALSSRIDAYCTRQGWSGEILRSETGVLPVVTGGKFAAFQSEQQVDGVICAGVRGGFSHPLTCQSLPQAVEIALAIASEADLPGTQLSALIEARARSHWQTTRFYRTLGLILFRTIRPDQRFRIFERFNRLPESLIERFYAARSTRLDRARILCSKPPVPVFRVLGAMLGPTK